MGDGAAAPEGPLSEAAEAPPAPDPAELEQPADDADESTTEEAEAAQKHGRHSMPAEPKAPRKPLSVVAWALIAGLIVLLGLSAAVGWLGWTAYQDRQAQEKRNLFLQVGRQGAVNLTTIDFAHVDDDVKRILDSATGSFYDEFQGRSQPFTQVVKQVKSRSVGNVTEAGVESQTDTEAQVLVAVTVNTTVEGQPDQAPRAWRMRILVQETGEDEAKVANVEFVP
ncbi:tetratricopeptide repeat protein [Mycolicibacterium arenosum]|uniref:Tetratricopeptide repeat protein n=1 Tax=Mycolicibacterium arenosum TaxID=2952157 RepID=A0ABT1LV34_9MYCO|nr:tetratricopeptide repeat protein [Mycolicibacterium sp. CAU 1645]MCP9270758.1 tetratricopeptide repeat protein [Mycolicibacterium sp. CAU 1645]